MASEKLPKEYLQWIEEEKAIAHNQYESYKKNVGTNIPPPWLGGIQGGTFRGKTPFLRLTAAAVLILTIGTTLWVKKDAIFKPKYTEEQIALSYEHAVKTLAVCASSLSKEMGQLKKLNEIPESIDNLNELENVINNK